MLIFSLIFIEVVRTNDYPLFTNPIIVHQQLNENSFQGISNNQKFIIKGDFQELRYGDIINPVSYSCKPTSNYGQNLETFNFINYALSFKIHYQCQITDYNLIKHSSNPYYLLLNFRNNLISYFSSPRPSYQLINSFILGNNNFSDTTNYYINNLGLSHLFVISGTHLQIFILLFTQLIGYFQMKFTYLKIAITGFMVFIYFLTGLKIATLRVIILFLYQLYYQKPLNLILFIDILIIINPFLLYNFGFILSFGLALFLQAIQQFEVKLNFLKINFLIFLYTAPLQLFFNGNLNPFSIIINYCLIFLFPFFIIYTLIIFIFPFNFILYPFDFILTLSNTLLIPFDFFRFYLPTLSIIGWGVYICFFSILFLKKQINYYLLFILIILIFFPKPINGVFLFDNQENYITVIKKQETFLIGEINQYNVDTLIKFCKHKMIYQIDHLIITQPNFNDKEVLPKLQQSFLIKEISINP